MRLFKATYKDRHGQIRESTKWDVEFRDHLKNVRRIALFTDEEASAEIGRKIEKLVACRMSGESPGPVLTRWLECVPGSFKVKLAKIGLLDSTRVAASKPINEHLDDFYNGLQAKSN